VSQGLWAQDSFATCGGTPLIYVVVWDSGWLYFIWSVEVLSFFNLSNSHDAFVC
jgi:hypothetical protein